MEKKTLYKTKVINFFGEDIRIVLQDRNGPCPLFSICNALSLRKRMKIIGDEVSQEYLVGLVADLMSRSITNGNDGGYTEEQKKIYNDAYKLLPMLATGIYVNMQFRRMNDFEFSAERAIFEIVDVPLYHGWLVDPKDHETSKALGSKSYETLLVELACLKSLENELGMNNVEENTVAVTTASLGVQLVSSGQSLESPSKKRKRDIDETVTPVVTLTDSISQKSETEKHAPKELDSTFEFNEPRNFQYDEPDFSNTMSSSGLLPSTADSASLIHKVDETESSSTANVDYDELGSEGEKRPEEELSIRQGELVDNFMKNNPTQLTVYGLSCLQKEVKEHEPCVFFRNEHFNTMVKHKGEIYLLATDVGYHTYKDLVWEKLNEVKGDNVYMTGEFKECKINDHANRCA